MILVCYAQPPEAQKARLSSANESLAARISTNTPTGLPESKVGVEPQSYILMVPAPEVDSNP